MNEIKINEHKINVPSHWEELRPEDLIYLGANFPFTDTPKFHLETFIYFCNLKFRFALKNVIRNLNASQLHDILSMGGKGALFMYLYKNPVMQKWKIKEIKAAEKALVARKFQEAYEHCLNAQTEMRLLSGAVKTWIPTKED